MRLYERCKAARRRTGLSQEAMAAELGVTRGAVAQWEMELGTSPSVENMIALARRCGVAFEWLATGRGAMVFGDPVAAEERGPYMADLRQEQRSLLAAFDRLTKAQRAGLLDLLSA